MQQENKPNFYAIIPATIRYDKRLTPNAKLLYGEITALANSKGYCWANNQYFADLYEVSIRSIKTWVSQLVDFGYIKSEMIYKNGSKEVEFRKITIIDAVKKTSAPSEENFLKVVKKTSAPSEESCTDNTTYNNTVNNTVNILDKTITPAKAVVKTKTNWLNILVNDYQISEEVAEQFIQYRKDKKATISKIVLNNLIEQSQILNIALDEAIKTMVINNWVGFKAEWVKNKNSLTLAAPHQKNGYISKQAALEAGNDEAVRLFAESLRAESKTISDVEFKEVL